MSLPAVARRVCPHSIEEAASILAEASSADQAVRVVGGASKLGWGRPGEAVHTELGTGGLDGVLEHNAADLTAVLQAGVPLARAQELFASAGQMLPLDPWLGRGAEATMGGVLATADSGPLSHRYGLPRDLVLGMTVVLSDGTVARSGGKVIKNVAGYDVAKLFCGSFGTLGLIASVNVRLHPRPDSTVTVVGRAADPAVLAAAAQELAAAPLELEALDIRWEAGVGSLLARCGGASAPSRSTRSAKLMAELELDRVDAMSEDEELWEGQRAGQRSGEDAVVRVFTRPSLLAGVLDAARACGARLVGRAALGLCFITVEDEAVARLIELLPARSPWILLDAPESLRVEIDPWGRLAADPALELCRRVKARFDPTATCNPGVFVGGI